MFSKCTEGGSWNHTCKGGHYEKSGEISFDGYFYPDSESPIRSSGSCNTYDWVCERDDYSHLHEGPDRDRSPRNYNPPKVFEKSRNKSNESSSTTRSCSPTTQKTAKIVMKFEGFRNRKYLCSAGKPTIGYGTLITDPNSRLHKATITKEEGLRLLEKSLAKARAVVKSCVTVPLTVNQGTALSSFVYNCGATAFRRSQLLKEVNTGRFDKVPGELRRWNQAKGKVCQGLVNRREEEIKIFLTKESQEDAKYRAIETERRGDPLLADIIFQNANLGKWLLEEANNTSLPVKTRGLRYIMACKCGSPAARVLNPLMASATNDQLLDFERLAVSPRFSNQKNYGFNNQKVAAHFRNEVEKRKTHRRLWWPNSQT